MLYIFVTMSRTVLLSTPCYKKQQAI